MYGKEVSAKSFQYMVQFSDIFPEDQLSYHWYDN